MICHISAIQYSCNQWCTKYTNQALKK